MENPLIKALLHSSQEVDNFMEWHKEIPVTHEQKMEFLNQYSKCHDCNMWHKDTDFSSFTLGMVLCKDCDR